MNSTVGIDWAEIHHDVALMNTEGSVIARARIDTGATGFIELLALIAENGGTPADTPIAIETDKNLIVVALSDPGDAAILANILRTDRDAHRTLPSTTEHARAVKALARQHQEALWALHQTLSRLRSVFLEFYPAALQAFPDQKHKAALIVLAAAPTSTAGRALARRRLVALLHRAGRRNDENLVNQILADLHAPALTQPPEVENALGHTVTGLLGIVAAMHTAVESLEKELGRVFDEHPMAPILTSVPGLGTVLSARILAEIGDDTARFASPAGLRAFAGTAPITRASGRSHYVKARKVRNKRLGDACHWWAFSILTKSAGARAHYDKRLALGERHNAALRNLANTLLGRLWWCLQRNEPWDDTVAWAPQPTATSTLESTAA